MGSNHHAPRAILFFLLINQWIGLYQCCTIAANTNASEPATLHVDASSKANIPDNLFGIFFEEINHAGAGGLWAELVDNRGFEAGAANNKFDPWRVLGMDESLVKASIDYASPFPRNRAALKLEVLCDHDSDDNKCPDGGVGIYNPGFWGMNIVKTKMYTITLFVRSHNVVDLTVSLTGANGYHSLGHKKIHIEHAKTWKKVVFKLRASASDPKGRLQITTNRKGVYWLDQISVMPEDTHKGHGFRQDLFKMLKDLKPGFIRFPGGNYVEGGTLSTSLKWKQTVGAWEERPGHLNDAWGYWVDDGLGQFEYLQLAEDLGALPIWVFYVGLSLDAQNQVPTNYLQPYIEDALDGLEFALGAPDTTWGSVRAKMGHPEPFDLRYVAVGNEDCFPKLNDQYQKTFPVFFDAIRKAYPNIKIINNCDGSSNRLNHPSDLYDFHIYPNSAASMIESYTHVYDSAPRYGPKAFVSEYAVQDNKMGYLVNALSEAVFLMSLERNGDLVEFASYAPLFVNVHDRKWLPDAIAFDSSKSFGTPSYWMQHFFIESNGASYVNSSLHNTPNDVFASTILWKDIDNNNYLRVKAVNIGGDTVHLKLNITGLGQQTMESSGAKVMVMESKEPGDLNSFENPKKVVPRSSTVNMRHMDLKLNPYSLKALDLLIS